MIDDEMEQAADDFAAHLLVPTHLLMRELGRVPPGKTAEWVVRALAKQFGVSELLMAGRLAEEGIRLT